MTSVFLSHSHQDKSFVTVLADKLSKRDIRVWIDEAEIRIGDSLLDRIGDAIEEMDFFLIVLSEHSINSHWVQKELEIAIQRELAERRIVVLPVMLEKVEPPPFLKNKRYADFTGIERFEISLSLLCESIMAFTRDRRGENKRNGRYLDIQHADNEQVGSGVFVHGKELSEFFKKQLDSNEGKHNLRNIINLVGGPQETVLSFRLGLYFSGEPFTIAEAAEWLDIPISRAKRFETEGLMRVKILMESEP